MRIKPLFVPDLPRSFFGRIALILATDKGTAQAMPLSRHHKIKTLPAKGNGKKGAWRTAAHQKAGHRSAESRAVLCGEYSSTCRRVLEYLPQSTPTASAWRDAAKRTGGTAIHAKRSTDWRAHDGHGHKTKLPAKETNPLQATLFYISCRQDTGRRPGAHSTPSSAGKCMPVMPMSLSEAYCMMRFREAMAAALSMS